MLAFAVTLDRASPATVTVDWETLNGAGKAGAKAGQDYVAGSGTLAFAPGETAKTVDVAVLDGEVSAAMLGADWTLGPGSGSGAGAWTVGLMMSHARGEGSYRGADGGKGGTVLVAALSYCLYLGPRG